MVKLKSCYPTIEAMKCLNPRCPNHYWNSGYGFCKLTGCGVNPKTCGKSFEWELSEEPIECLVCPNFDQDTRKCDGNRECEVNPK